MSPAAGARRPSSRTVAVAIVVGALSCVTCGGAALWAGRVVQRSVAQALGIDDTWTAGRLTRAEVERQFDLRLPASASPIYHRSLGFQDPYLEVLLPIADRAAFEAANGLTEAPPAEDVSAADAQVRAVASPRGVVTAVGLAGITDRVHPDGGFIEWSRHGSLLVYDDQVWLSLVAFGT